MSQPSLHSTIVRCTHCKKPLVHSITEDGLLDTIVEVMPCEYCMQKIGDKVITTDDEDRAFKMCECAECKTVSECTSNNDFYTIPQRADNLLYCESCMMKIAKETTGTQSAMYDNQNNQCW